MEELTAMIVGDAFEDVFERITDLWKEFEGKPAVSRVALHKRIWESWPKPKSPELELLVHGGINDVLDAFAKSGANYANYKAVLGGAFEPPAYYRYKVTRDGEVMYVLRDTLSFDESIAIIEELRRKDAAARQEADELRRFMEKRNQGLVS